MAFEQSSSRVSSTQPIHLPPTTRRRKGAPTCSSWECSRSLKCRPSLPSLGARRPSARGCVYGMLGKVLPLDTCSMLLLYKTLEGHTSPITALDFSEPYGSLVSASQDDSQPRVWDLFSGIEIGRLRGHTGAVKSIQVEGHLCLSGGEDGDVRVWDLRKVDDEPWGDGEMVSLSDVVEEVEDDVGELVERPNGIRDDKEDESGTEKDGPSLRVLGGHTKAVTALYFEDECLVCSSISPLFAPSY